VACAVLAIPATAVLGQAPTATPPAPQIAPSLVPSYTVDLMTPEGSAAFGAQWKTMEAKIVESPPIKDAMPAYKTGYDIMPHAGEAGFDDSAWPVIDAKGLAARRGAGKVSFIWYRANLTIPARDYAEIWINGQMPRRSGYPSPATIQGLNMPNRVVLADAVRAGDKFQIAVWASTGRFRLLRRTSCGSARRRSISTSRVCVRTATAILRHAPFGGSAAGVCANVAAWRGVVA
jgi:hypothetical protein